MTYKLSKFTLRVSDELLKKLRFIAEYSAHSTNRELEILMIRHIAEFEKKHGTITLD